MPLVRPLHLLPPQQRLRRLRERAAWLRHRMNIVVVALAAEEELQAVRQRRPRRYWVRPWIQRRSLYGQYETLMAELRRESPEDFKAYLRVDCQLFREMYERVCPLIRKSEQYV